MKKTFEFTEQQAELLRKEQYKYLINDNMDHFLFLVQQIVSERITKEPETIKPYHEHGNSVASDRTEPGESGQSAEDVIKYLEMSVDGRAYSTMIRAVISNHLKTHPEKLPIELVLDIYNAMRLHASQVCAGKDEIIKERELEILSLTYDKDKEIDRLNESLIVLLRKNAELEEQIEEHRQLGMERSERD